MIALPAQSLSLKSQKNFHMICFIHLYLELRIPVEKQFHANVKKLCILLLKAINAVKVLKIKQGHLKLINSPVSWCSIHNPHLHHTNTSQFSGTNTYH